MAQDYKRSLSRVQMDNDKLDHDIFDRSEKERQLQQQLKESDDRVSHNGLLPSHYNHSDS